MKKKSEKALLKRCLYEIQKCEPQALRMAFGLAVMEALLPLGPSFLASILVSGLEEGEGYERLVITAAVGVVLLLFMNAFRSWTWRCGLPHSEYANDLVEWKFDNKNMEMDYSRLDSSEAAGIRARIENDYDWGCGAYYMIPQFQRCCSGILGIAASLVLLVPILLKGSFWRHWSTLVFAVCVLTLTFLTTVLERYTCREKEKKKEQYDISSARSNYLMRGGITYREGKDIRIYKAQPLIRSGLNEKERDEMVEVESRLEQRAGIWDGAASGILMGGAYFFIVLRAAGGALEAGSVVLFASAIYRLAENMKIFSRSRSEIMMNAGRMESSFAYLELPDEMPKGRRKVERRHEEMEIEVRNVSFRYPGADHKALENVSFRFTPGRKLAVVGMNGSGKTTLVKLLCRMYDPDEGQILLNGVDIREYDLAEYMKQFSVVFQDFRLLARSLGENVAASQLFEADRVQECLEKAGFGERLMKLPEGINTSLYRNTEEEGVEVSGGEAQKIALARALYKDAPFVVLDEPTAALDPVSEHEIYSGFHRLVGEKAALFISHRLSSCRFCDEILVFHEGRLVQKGSHTALLKEESGQYCRMWRAQARYYEDTGAFIA